MEKIDLTKCNNCRFKAKIDGIVTTGIVSAKDGLNAFLKNEQGYNVGCLTGAGLVDSDNRPITDFEIVPRDPETYQDWQVGDIACEEAHRNARYEVIFRSGELVFFKDWNNWASNPMTCSEAFTRFGMRLVLTDIEKQIIEEKPAEDMQALIAKELDGHTPRGRIEGFPMEVIAKMLERQYEQTGKVDVKVFEKFLPSPKEDGGFSWKCTPEGFDFWKEVLTFEDFSAFFRLYPREDKRQFRKFDPVLVRDESGKEWRIAAFVRLSGDSDYLYVVKYESECLGYRYCIPYNERTMHLLGTNDDYEEEQP